MNPGNRASEIAWPLIFFYAKGWVHWLLREMCSCRIGWDFGLWPYHFHESHEKGHHLFVTDEEACKFHFGIRGHKKLDYLCYREYWSIDVGNGDIFR